MKLSIVSLRENSLADEAVDIAIAIALSST